MFRLFLNGGVFVFFCFSVLLSPEKYDGGFNRRSPQSLNVPKYAFLRVNR